MLLLTECSAPTVPVYMLQASVSQYRKTWLVYYKILHETNLFSETTTGDHIHVSGVNNETDTDGSCCWIVSKVTLFSTTLYWSVTNECATISNAAIANSRIINGARSPHAKLKVVLKFGIDVPYERIVIFKSAVEQYMKARPREWLQLVGFRASNVVVDRGFSKFSWSLVSSA